MTAEVLMIGNCIRLGQYYTGPAGRESNNVEIVTEIFTLKADK